MKQIKIWFLLFLVLFQYIYIYIILNKSQFLDAEFLEKNL